MNTLIETIEPWLQSLVILSWKGTLLALSVGLALLLLHRHLSPAWRHGLWLLVLLRFTVPDIGFFPVSLDGLVDMPALLAPAPPVAVEQGAAVVESFEVPPPIRTEALPQMANIEAPAAPVTSSVRAPAPALSVAQKLSLAWLCGVVAVFGGMSVLHLRLLRRLRKDAASASPAVIAVLDEACRLAHVTRTPRLIVTDAIRAPSLFGVLRPAILLPKQVAAGNDVAALKLILLHELAHLKRHDLWAQILASGMIALHWFNPMVWVAARRLRAEAEMAADAHALRCTDATEAHRFGEVLLGFAQHAATGWMVWFAAATLLGISDNKNDLRRRIEGLMDIARGRRTRWVIGLGAFMVLAVTGLTSSPAEEVKKTATKEVAKGLDDSPTTTVTGIVVDKDGKPVKGAKVRMLINLMTRSDTQDRFTGEDGLFRFEAVPKEASMSLRAEHNGFGEPSLLVFKGISESKERRIVLPDIYWVVGKITDKRDGKPIKDAQVIYGVENKFTAVSRFDWKHPFARTNEAGEYRLPVKVRDVNDIIVRAWAPDMAVQSKVIHVTEHETAFSAALEPVERIPGRVVNKEGQPVKDAMVWVVEDAVRLDETLQPITLEMMRSDKRVNMTVGKFFISLDYSLEKGAVRLPDVDPLLKDKLWVVAMHPEEGFARMRARDLKPGFVFKLELWASISGRMIRRDGTPVAKSMGLIIASEDAGELTRPESFKINHNIKVISDKNGGYEIDRLLPGSSFSGITINGANAQKEYLPTATVAVSSGPQRSRQMILEPSLRQDQVGAVRAVQGRIVLPEGYSFRESDYIIDISMSSNGASITGMPRPDQDGRFITEMLPPGIYELRVMVMSRTPGMDLPKEAGRWMHFKVEAGGSSFPMRLPDIILEKEDLTPKPRDEKSALAAQAPVLIEGPNGRIEIETTDADKKPVPGVRIEVLDLVDHAHTGLGVDQALIQTLVVTSDANGKARLMFPRTPAPGRRAFGVQVVGTARNGDKSRQAEVLDGRKAELRLNPETPVDLAISNPIVQWSAGSSMGLIAEDQPIQAGALKARLALEHATHFVLQGKTAEGKVLFSNAIGAAKDKSQEIKAAVTLMPGVEIEGKIEGLPENDEGTGGVVARVYVKSEGEINQISKGFPPLVPWAVWVPVARDGRFHITGMPRGIVSLSGFGKGWITRGSMGVDSHTLVKTGGSTGKVSVSLSAKPSVTRAFRVLLPDGSPAAGATVQMGWPGLELSVVGHGRLYAEDAGEYARFQQEAWTAKQAVVNAQGQVTLGNRLPGKAFCQVYWVDPKTQFPRYTSVYFPIEEQESDTPVEVKLTEK